MCSLRASEFGSAPRSSSRRAASTWPKKHASPSGWKPSSPNAFAAAGSSSSSSREPIGSAERRRLEHVQLGVVGEELRHLSSLPRVEGLEQPAHRRSLESRRSLSTGRRSGTAGSSRSCAPRSRRARSACRRRGRARRACCGRGRPARPSRRARAARGRARARSRSPRPARRPVPGTVPGPRAKGDSFAACRISFAQARPMPAITRWSRSSECRRRGSDGEDLAEPLLAERRAPPGRGARARPRPPRA